MASNVPLYKDAPIPQTIDRGHAGLWFDKFCAWKTLEIEGTRLPEIEKKDWIKTLAGGKVGSEELLTEHITRRQQLMADMRGRAVCIKTASRFVTGLGYPHPIENGFAWHHTLGTPYLPGSGLKGVARAWAKLMEPDAPDQRKQHEQIVRRVFGPPGEKENLQSGSVIFLEAIPCSPVEVVAEVMTPHYAPYYQKGDGTVPPGDYHNPVPIPFLTVRQGTTFFAGVLPRTPGDANDVEQAFKWLLEGLVNIGAGAKTATGYGRFEKDEQGEAKWRIVEQAVRQRTATPLERMRELVRTLSEGQLYSLVPRNLQKGELTDEAEQAAFRQAAMETPYFSAWKKGQAMDSRQVSAGAAKLKAMAQLIEGKATG